ncbi:BolA/IbaG family iron-sulfur metabolism protein [Myxococcota bacterium]|nr:BolA/IbaG family iron-sulfur metabolism protein [Myxococcota bacterium]
MTTEEVRAKLAARFPDATIVVKDLTGGGDHFRAEITTPEFAGKSMIEQHRMVYAALGRDVGGPIHALQLVTKAS